MWLVSGRVTHSKQFPKSGHRWVPINLNISQVRAQHCFFFCAKFKFPLKLTSQNSSPISAILIWSLKIKIQNLVGAKNFYLVFLFLLIALSMVVKFLYTTFRTNDQIFIPFWSSAFFFLDPHLKYIASFWCCTGLQFLFGLCIHRGQNHEAEDTNKEKTLRWFVIIFPCLWILCCYWLKCDSVLLPFEKRGAVKNISKSNSRDFVQSKEL